MGTFRERERERERKRRSALKDDGEESGANKVGKLSGVFPFPRLIFVSCA